MISGQSTSDALKILHDELKTAFENFERKRKPISNSFSNLSIQTGFLANGAHLILMFICSCLYLASFSFLEHRDYRLLVQGIIVFLFTIINGFLLRNDLLETKNITNKKVNHLLDYIKELSDKKSWNQSSFAQLHIPTSQSISLLWTVRDSEVVGLPLCLVVAGDVILLRPGQKSTVKCSPLDEAQISVRSFLKSHQSATNGLNEDKDLSNQVSSSQLRSFLVLETPYLPIFKEYLKNSLTRKLSQLENTRHHIFNILYHYKVFPLILLFMLVINVSRVIFLSSYSGSMLYMLVVLQLQCIFPLLPTISPLCWRLVDLVGVCQLSIFEHAVYQNPLSQFKEPTTRDIMNCLRGAIPLLPSPFNASHVLGSITSMCCVDKKGLLSWPIPTAEKVFFFTNNHHNPSQQPHFDEFNGARPEAEAHCHVLNLTQDLRSQHDLTFDDNSWEEYLSSLKPIGLNALLNCCNSCTLDKYTHFSDHITHLAQQHSKYISVANRRCLCELSRHMGFQPEAHKLFTTKEMFGVLSSTVGHTIRPTEGKYKMPFPNIFVVKLEDMSTGIEHLHSQGTADLLLQQCSHYWDGKSVRVLGTSERKRINDFYQRTSMTSYCTAFSYKPLVGQYRSPQSFVVDLPEYIDLKYTANGKSIYHTNNLYTSTYTDIQRDNYQEDKHHFFGKQVFLGMVTMQYRAVENVVSLIEILESRCIKFVHFSTENELRSRVFSEKMGLEAGWNCHISLLEEDEEDVTKITDEVFDQGLDEVGCKMRRVESRREERLRLLWNTEQHHRSVPFLHPRPSIHSPITTTPSNDGTSPIPYIAPKNSIADSYGKNTSIIMEHSIEEINDIQNRAQLPKGIRQIRPHLRNTDNVPLQVPLFTDCTPHTTNQMFEIFHEYNEVICCVGSSLNFDNFMTYIKADCSFCISPMPPEICIKSKVESPLSALCKDEDDDNSHMVSLASLMLSLPSTMLLRHQHISQLPLLISMGRKHLRKLHQSSKVFFSFLCAVVSIQLITTILILPPSIPPSFLVWFCIVVIPLLSVSLMTNPDYSQIPYVKHGQYWEKFLKRTFLRESSCFVLKFIPSILFLILIFAFNLYHLCCHHAPINTTYSNDSYSWNSSLSSTVSSLNKTAYVNNNTRNFFSSPCYPFIGSSNCTSAHWSGHGECPLVLSQHILALQLLVLFIFFSLSNIHPLEFSWKKNPLRNPICCLLCAILLLIQLAWFCATSCDVTSISTITWCLLPVWMVCTCVLHEAVKVREIGIWIRHQKRAKLDFGTKLGMNSPF